MPKKGGGKDKGGKKSKKDDDFEEFLENLQEVTKESGEKHKKDAAPDAASRKALHEERQQAIAKAKSADVERMLDVKLQMQQLQALLNKGSFLPKPNTECHSQHSSNEWFEVASACTQGWRTSMEDKHVSDLSFLPEEKAGLFGVFDGHMGNRCATIASIGLPALAKKYYSADELRKGVLPPGQKSFFHSVFLELDASVKKKLPDSSGSTAVVVLVSGTAILCAHVGDSRAVLCRNGKAIALTVDHKPELPTETERITKAGGYVENNRVNGCLAMSRAMGDFTYKNKDELSVEEQAVIPVPDVMRVERTPQDEFILIACDGVFDVLTNEEVTEFVRDRLQRLPPGGTIESVVRAVCERCVAPPSVENPSLPSGPGTDNVTVTLVRLKS